MKKLMIAFCLAAGLSVAGKAMELSPLFTDGMVVAENRPVRVFGTGRGRVEVSFRGQTASASAAEDGPWSVELPAGAAGGPFELRIVLDGRERIVRDVRVGVVLLMAGQSNMGVRLRSTTTPPSVWRGDARIRCFSTDRLEPGDPFSSTNGWVALTSENAGKWGAIAYETATRIAAARDVAVGVVNCFQGASTIQTWLPPEETAKPCHQIPKGGKLHMDHFYPRYAVWNQPHGTLYRKQFRAVAPYAVSSVVWYQGESNTGKREGETYAGLLEALMRIWRADLREEDLQFVIVQLADYVHRNDADWRRVQQAQEEVTARDPHARLVRAADICEPYDIHPRAKAHLGQRIAGVLLGRTDDAYAPTVVGVPPRAAARDLCVTADGEIRHYGVALLGGSETRVYRASRDGLEWTTHRAAEDDVGAMVRSPWSGDWIYFTGMDPVTLVRSKTGPGDERAERRPTPWRKLELRQILPLKSRKRWLAAFSDVTCASGACYRAVTAYSDDDGRTWTRTDLRPVAGVERRSAGDRRPHWYNDGCEPTFAELKDGTILLCVRTSGPHAAFYRSTDGGATWGEGRPDPAFWQANTMPYLFRLRDGRLLFVWNNTAMLPTRDLGEYPELAGGERDGTWESVFTNRDALHAAISEDDGRTWRGFREIFLNEIRNASDFRELGNWPGEEHDKSVHQTQALELADGRVLLSLGQNSSARRLVVFDPNWLLETARRDDFSHGLGGLSNHLYVRSLTGGWRGWAGHCAWNRMPGATLVRDPDTDAPAKGTRRSVREVLQLCRIRDPRLVSDRQGVTWNFPAARKGVVTLDCRIAGSGFRLSLADHWMNPSDETGPARSPFSQPVEFPELRAPGWHKLSVAWDCDAGTAKVSVDGKAVSEARLSSVPPFGLSYLHLQTLAEETDAQGTYFREFSFHARL